MGKVELRRWLINLFASAINNTTRADDRAAAVRWLTESREIVGSDRTRFEKFKDLNALINSRAAVKAVSGSIAKSASNYKNSDLPWAIKIALPATLAASMFVGGHGVGIAALGSAIGAPALLLVFIGTAGITAVIESVIVSPESRSQIASMMDTIIQDEALRRVNAHMKAAMREKPADANRFVMPEDEIELRQRLLELHPHHFEQHVMGLFQSSGLRSWVTQQSNDFGVDGFAVHPQGLIVTQCKRNAPGNKVGRPIVQQFKGVVEEQGAWRGYIVTTAEFTAEAIGSARSSSKIELIDMSALVAWHKTPPLSGAI